MIDKIIKAKGGYWQIKDKITSAVASGANEYCPNNEYLCVKVEKQESGHYLPNGGENQASLIYPYQIETIVF